MGRKPASHGIEAREATIRITFQWRGQRCRETLRLPPTPPNLKYAERLRAEIQRKIEFAQFEYADYFPNSRRLKRLGLAPAASPKFGHLADQWLIANSHLAKSTKQGYANSINTHLRPTLNDRPINTITYGELSGLLGAYLWRSLKTRNNTIIPLRGIFDTAFEDGLIKTNPCARLKNSKVQRAPPDPLTLDEVNQVLDEMGRRYPEQVRNYFEFAFFAGPRTSEAIALKWSDIDWQHDLARIQRAKVRKEIKGTKTQRVRDIELNSRALAALRRQKAHTALMDDTIFHDPATGRPYLSDATPREKYWLPTLKALGIRRRSASHTRHTFATLNLMAGANPMWVARQLGHVNMKMVLEVYSKWIDQADKSREKNKLEIAINAHAMPQAKQKA